MAASSETITSTAHPGYAPVWSGTFTSDATVGAHTMTFPVHLSYIHILLDVEGVNVDELEKTIHQTTQTNLITGSSGISTTPTDATGITITNNAAGSCTVLVAADSQTDSAVNYWYAFTKV